MFQLSQGALRFSHYYSCYSNCSTRASSNCSSNASDTSDSSTSSNTKNSSNSNSRNSCVFMFPRFRFLFAGRAGDEGD